jgi:predicted Fe-Mo cluster-binding NifX family protein
MRIAVTSKSGTDVDQHFGHAQRFLIYDYRSDNPAQIAAVEVEKYCSFDPDHPFRHRQFDAIVAAIKGCQAVVTAQIGDLPKTELEKAGIRAVIASGPIPAALKLAHDSVCGGHCKGKMQPAQSCPHL